mgnify:CR=1 FL=1
MGCVFYTLQDYEKWKESHKGWSIKYYKGLGTSTPKEAKEYFKDMKIVNYKFVEETSDEAIGEENARRQVKHRCSEPMESFINS